MKIVKKLENLVIWEHAQQWVDQIFANIKSIKQKLAQIIIESGIKAVSSDAVRFPRQYCTRALSEDPLNTLEKHDEV